MPKYTTKSALTTFTKSDSFTHHLPSHHHKKRELHHSLLVNQAPTPVGIVLTPLVARCLPLPEIKLKPFTLLLFMVLLLAGFQTKAQVTVSLQYTEKNNVTTLPAGSLYTMQLDYSISSTTGNASGVKAVIKLPDNIIDVTGFVGTTHAPAANFVFDNTPGAKKVTINFIEPVPSGSTGVLEVGLILANGTIPNGTVVTTTAELTSTGGFTSGVQSNSMTVTAAPYICTRKTLQGGGALDNNTTYAIRITGNDFAYGFLPNGYLNATNITLTDDLPAGAEFVSAQLTDRFGTIIPTSISQSGGVVTAVIPDLTALRSGTYGWETAVYDLFITVKYNTSAGFTAGQTVNNVASLVFTPRGGSPITVADGSQVSANACINDLQESLVLAAPTANAMLSKTRGYGVSTTIFPGQLFSYCINFANTGNVPLENVELIENIPPTLRFAGKGFSPSSPIDHFEYQTNLNSSWTTGLLNTSDPGPDPNNPAEYYTKIKIVLISPLPANAFLPNNGSSCPTIAFTPATEVTTDTPVQNCLEWNSSTVGIPANRTVCENTIVLKPRPSEAIVFMTNGHAPACAAPYVVGQVLDNSLTVSTNPGGADLENPVLMLFPSPAGAFEYVPGSATFITGTSSLTVTPTFEYIPNYAGTGRFLLRWKFPAGTKLPHGTSMSVSAKVKITNVVTSGHQLWAYVSGTNIGSFTHYTGTQVTETDVYDLNSNGSVTDTLGVSGTSYSSCPITVSSSASMESIKWVKGQLDTDYSRYPASGNTVPGGKADYKLVVTNTGNVPTKNIIVVDILPFVGDKGVIDLSARNTEWRPNLAGPITAPAGVTVYYSTAQNPCRDEMKAAADPSPFPTGCTVANWSSAPPTDITTVQSLKFDFGSIVINPSDSLLLTWAMRAPVAAPTNGEIAWNSFGFVATRTDNNTPLLAAEPIKVGIKLAAPAPAYYGDYVWYDINHNGLQDAGEQGVDGVKVILFQDNGDGVVNPATDMEMGFTITGNGGKYLFPNLLPGNYYAVFVAPASYSVSPANQGANDAIDSDGTAITYLGSPAYVTTITQLDALEEDLTWDLGIYCGFIPTVASNSPVVVGGTLSLSASGGGTYAWTGPNGFVSTLPNPTIPNVTTANAGTYRVTVDNNGCYASLTVDVLVQEPSCGLAIAVTPGLCLSATNSYVLSGSITATNVPTSGTLTISSGAFSPRSLTLPAGNASGTFSYSGLISNGQAFTVTTSYSNSACSPVSATYTAPASCSVAPPCSLSAAVTAGQCASATNTYSASVVVSLANAPAGTLTVTLPGASGPISQTIAANTSSFTAVFGGLISDGASHTATVSLPGCGTTTATYTAPASCSIAPVCSLTATITPSLCASATNTYSATAIMTVNNPVAGTLTVTLAGVTQSFATTANAQNTFTAVFNGLISDGQSHTLTASLPGCSTTTAAYTAPASCSVAPVCSLTATATPGLCASATNTYSATAVVTIQNPGNGGTLTISNGTISQPFTTTAGKSNTFTMVFNGLIPDGASHTITASLPGCSTTTTTYTAPTSCSVAPACGLTATVTPGLCASATNTYSATAVVRLTNPPAGTLTVSDGPRSLTTSIASGLSSFSFTATFNGLVSDGTAHTIVSSLPGCTPQSVTYTAPASCSVAPVCSLMAVATPGLCASATNTFSNTVNVTMTNPTAGTLAVTDGVRSVTTAVPATTGTVTFQAIFNGLVSNGATNTVTATLSGCGTTTTTYTAPASCTQATPAVAVNVTPGVCQSATNQYDITGTLSLTNAVAGTATITDGIRSTTVAVSAGATSVPYSLTGLSSGTGSHTVTVIYAGQTGSVTYTAPVACVCPPAKCVPLIIRRTR